MKAVIFDLGGVLIDLDMQRCFDSIRSLGVDLDAQSKASDMMNLYQIGKVSTEEFIGLMLRLSREGSSYQQLLDAWNSCLLTIPDFKLEFIKELRQLGYATYLLSNTNDAHWKYIAENSFPEPVGNYFDCCFLSQEMGMAKPDAAIYESVLQQIGIPAEECLFLDDSKANCEAAERLGINCINVAVRSDYREDVKNCINKCQR